MTAAPQIADPVPDRATRASDYGERGERGVGLIFSLAFVVALVGTVLCFDAEPGVNWGIWTVVAAGGLAAASWRARGRAPAPVMAVLGLACALGIGAAVTTNPLFQFLVLSGTATLLAVATLLASGERVGEIGARFLALAPLSAFVRVAAESMRRVLGGLERLRGQSALLRGSALALPVVAVLALLLSGADPVFAAWRVALVNGLGADTLARCVFLGALGGLSLGAYGLALAPAERVAAIPASDARRGLLGDTERLIVLGSVVALFASFLVLQVAYFVGDVPSIAGSGVTYADWARRGFGELTVAATLSALLVVCLDRFAERGEREGQVRAVSLVLLLLVALLLDSALRRLRLYEAAYGFTAARLYAQAYMVLVSAALIALGIEIWGAIDVRRLARRVALAGVLVAIGLTYWNHDAWIARHNLTRFARAGQLDTDYLVVRLSADAVPVIVESLPDLPAVQRAALTKALAVRYGNPRVLRMGSWYEANLRRERARAALEPLAVGR